MFDILTPVHIAIIFAVALLLFGPKRLPEIGQGLGKTIREFRNAMREGSLTAGVSNQEGEKPSKTNEEGR